MSAFILDSRSTASIVCLAFIQYNRIKGLILLLKNIVEAFTCYTLTLADILSVSIKLLSEKQGIEY